MSVINLQNIINRKIVAEFLLISVTFFWGTTFILVKLSIQEIPVFAFLTIRFTLATLLTFSIFIRVNQRRELKLVDHFTKGSLIGFILWTTFAFQTVGLVYTSPAVAAFLTGLNVVFTPLIGLFLFKFQIQLKIIIVSLLAFVGVSFLSGIFELELSQTEGQLQLVGNALIILCALGIAFHILLTEKYAPTLDPIGLLFFQLLISSVLSLGGYIFWSDWNPHNFNPFSWSPVIWITLIITVLFATVLAYFIQSYYQSQNVLSGSRIALIFTFEPIFAALTTVVVLGDIFTPLEFLGAAFILFAILLAREED